MVGIKSIIIIHLTKTFSGLIVKSITVRTGSLSSRSGGNIVGVKQIIQHDKYAPSVHDFDFALLKLDMPLKFSDKINVIALPNAEDEFENVFCALTGWGQLN